MLTKRSGVFAAAAVTLAVGFVGTIANAADIFTLGSTTFQDGRMMPKKVANSQANMATNPVVLSTSRLILVENNIECPMQHVFDAPVFARDALTVPIRFNLPE